MNRKDTAHRNLKPYQDAPKPVTKTENIEEPNEEKVKLAGIQTQPATKLEYKKAIVGANLAVATAVAISFFSTQSALRASRVVGGHYEVKLHEYDDTGQPWRGPVGKPVGQSQVIIPIEFGGVFTKPPRDREHKRLRFVGRC